MPAAVARRTGINLGTSLVMGGALSTNFKKRQHRPPAHRAGDARRITTCQRCEMIWHHQLRHCVRAPGRSKPCCCGGFQRRPAIHIITGSTTSSCHQPRERHHAGSPAYFPNHCSIRAQPGKSSDHAFLARRNRSRWSVRLTIPRTPAPACALLRQNEWPASIG